MRAWIRLRRWIRHWLTPPLLLRRTFPPAMLHRLGAAIAAAEAGHSGEIRFAVEAALPWSYLRRNLHARDRAWMVFSKLRVWDTEHNNGVLLYVELADRAVEIVVDRGIAQRVPKADWQAVCHHVRERFRAGRFEDGVADAVRQIGAKLAANFPLQAGEARSNELPDDPVVLRE